VNIDNILQNRLDRLNRTQVCIGENGEEASYGTMC
jgi:hypothetical protein